MKRSIIVLLLVLSAALTTACGSKGGGNSVVATAPTTAVVRISTQGPIADGTLIGGIDVTVKLPSGVTVKSITSPPETDSGVVAASGVAVNSMVMAKYTPAAGTTAGTVRVLVINSGGFGTGEFLTVNCDIATGSTPTSSDVGVTNFTATDLNGAAISGLTTGFTASIQ